MASQVKKKSLRKRNKWIIGVFATIIALFILVMIFGSPSAENVFKDMNEKMLATETVMIDEKMTMKGTGEVTLNMYLDMSDSNKTNASGSFSMDINSDGTPLTFSGDLIKVGDNNYVRFTEISSTNPSAASSLASVESKLGDNWIKIRDKDQFASIAKSPIEFLGTILPTPFANLDNSQRKKVLDILQDKGAYTIEESSEVKLQGVSAYKYQISYDKARYRKAADLIAGYNSFFTAGKEDGDEVKNLTVWVDKSTKRIIKIEYTGTTKDGNEVEGTISFTDYDKKKTVTNPSDYSIESELLE